MQITQEIIDSAPQYFNEVVLDDFKNQNIDCWVAGGSVRDYLIGIEPKDYDIYFPNNIEYKKADRYLEEMGGICVFENENGKKYRLNENYYDLVKRFNKSPEDTISRFDYTICMFAIDGNNLYGGDTSMEDLENNRLKINYITNADSSLERSYRFAQRGFLMPTSEHQKLAKIIRGSKEKGYSNFVSGQPRDDRDDVDDNVESPQEETQENNTDTPPPTTLPQKDYSKFVLYGALGLLVVALLIRKSKTT
jgi:hypothetical protein